ncbi:DUF883 family protein [Pseudoduganella dura]|nr:DUF883 family protein [Pseudoduganella dura]GGY17276.1 membrane protein [Pseudoduganella dura]
MDQTTNNTNTSKTANDVIEARDRLVGDLKTAISDAEQWLRGAAGGNGADLGEVKSRLQEKLRTAKEDLLKVEDTVLAKSKAAAQCADTYVHDNPWRAVVIGGVVGLLAGVIISRD